jgi:hypothetical protein
MTPKSLLRLHESACFTRAYPVGRDQLEKACRTLSSFARRRDLARHAEALADSGIAGTPIRYRFFWPMARWLAVRYPRLLTIDWREDEFSGRLGAALPYLVTQAEAEAIRRGELSARDAIDRLRAPRETDASFLIARIGALPGGDLVKEATHDAIDVAYRLAGDDNGPSRTHAFYDGAPFAFRSGPPSRMRPDIATELRHPPRSVRTLPVGAGRRLIDLAREAMVTRSRDLDAFSHGDPRDVRLIDDGDGLAFALIGVVPERRSFLPAMYGALTLRNGVPIGYVQLDVLFRNAEVSYNTFATFRGGEAGFVFTRLLAACRHLFGVTTFSIEPYQLGRGNEEGIASGAWWFYARFGFRPRDPAVARLAVAELSKRSKNPAYRSGRAVLLKLAGAHMFWPADRKAPRAVVTPYAAVGLAIGKALAAVSGADREAALDLCEARAGQRLGVPSTRRWSRSERLWWRRWSPLIALIPGIERWPARWRRDLVATVRAKAGRREADFVHRFDAHPRLAAAVATIGARRSGVG